MKKEQHLVIVESPTKAKTLAKFLPKEYKISFSMGHIRDLPKITKTKFQQTRNQKRKLG